jgi:hypothetical protein
VILLGSSAISEAMNKIVEGTIIDKESPSKTLGSIRFNRESGSNEIDESDSQYEKHDDPTISISEQILMDDNDEKLRINR